MESVLNNDLPIGIFDSGVGGLTVYRALRARLPKERFIYLGDTARVPYGTRSLSTIERYAVENAKFLGAQGIKILVVACNTASALALPVIRKVVNVPVVGVIDPGAQASVDTSSANKIGIIATEATIQSGAYRNAIIKIDSQAEVIERACPLFVPLAEEGWADTEVARLVAKEYLKDLTDNKLDTLVLGCTHYPILRRVIQETVGQDVRLIDSGEATANVVATMLEREGLLRSSDNKDPEIQLCGDLDHFYVTDAAARFARVAERFLGCPPAVLKAVEVWGQDELRSN
jgi:glutamate racemase